MKTWVLPTIAGAVIMFAAMAIMWFNPVGFILLALGICAFVIGQIVLEIARGIVSSFFGHR